MPVSLIPSFLSFCFINGITPGPANLCSLSTAMNEGKQAALSSFVLPYTKDFLSLLLVGAFLPFTGPVCNLAWLFAGVKLQKLFQQHRMVISLLMALSLAYCAISLVSRWFETVVKIKYILSIDIIDKML